MSDDVRAFLDAAWAPWKLHNADGTTLTGDMLRAVLDERDALRGAVERVRALADEWERQADSIAITYQDPDRRAEATGGRRHIVRMIRSALDGPQ